MGTGNFGLRTRKILTCLFLGICILGVATSIYMNFVNRSLWLDEAMLSYSFGKRDLSNLWNGKFEANQIAPLGWLYFVKLITMAFGNTEFTLRIASIVFYILTIGALYYYVRKSLGYTTVTALACSALYANLPFVLRYSNVFKPYIADGFFVLLVLIAFVSYRSGGGIRAWQLGLIWCCLIWFSNPVVFVQAGCLIVELVATLREKDWKKFRQLFFIGAAILACFIIYYLFWLRSVAVSDEMQGYWEGDNFPLIPTSLNDLIRIAKSVHYVFHGFGKADELIMLALAGFAAAFAIWKRKREHLYILVSTGVALVASWLHFFPMSDRLWLFYLPLMAVFCLTAVEDFCGTDLSGKWSWLRLALRTVLPVALVLAAWGIPTFLGRAENVYWQTEELNGEIDYLAEHVQADEPVYVYFQSTYGWQYKLGYDNHSIGGFENNVTYGTVVFREDRDCDEEIKRVLGFNKLYIASSHLSPERFFQLEKALRKNGHLELIYYEHQTPLWFFCRDLSNSKINVILKYDQEKGTVRIRNIGPAWLNHEYETVWVVDEETGTQAEMPKLIAPGREVELNLACGKNTRLTLKNEEGIIAYEGGLRNE